MNGRKNPRSMTLTETVAAAISEATGHPFHVTRRHDVGGGCINAAEVLEGGDRKYFVKLHEASGLDMFEAEAAGLTEILKSHTLRAPRPVVSGQAHGRAFLVLEYLDLGGRDGNADATLGRQLAAMHRVTNPEFGWWRDNTIGSTPQCNTREADWPTFYREHRLRSQLELATARRGGARLLQEGEKLLGVVPAFFADYQPRPSLLHGDLWGGNHGALPGGTPVIFDPAVYYGDREADLAMTELFGGFGSGFYSAYNEAWLLDSGYTARKNLYHLYHVLNHFNLFGGGYAAQAERLIGALLAEAR
jgi:fructosamine-3-kinase